MSRNAASDHGYVGRVRGCGCAVFVCVDDPKYADEISEALHSGLYLERMTGDEIRASLKLGCDHQREPVRPGGFKLWRVESAYVVAAPDEDDALAVDVDHCDPPRRAIAVDPSTLDGHEVVYLEDDEWEPPTLEQWLASEPTDAERERMNRITLEEQGQARLAL